MVSRRRAESGFALLTALVVVTLLSIALALLAASLQIRMRLVRQESQALELMALSDAVVAETLYNLTFDHAFHGVDARTFGKGLIASTVEPLGPHRYRVIATASFEGRRRSILAEVVRTPDGARVVQWERLPESGVPPGLRRALAAAAPVDQGCPCCPFPPLDLPRPAAISWPVHERLETSARRRPRSARPGGDPGDRSGHSPRPGLDSRRNHRRKQGRLAKQPRFRQRGPGALLRLPLSLRRRRAAGRPRHGAARPGDPDARRSAPDRGPLFRLFRDRLGLRPPAGKALRGGRGRQPRGRRGTPRGPRPCSLDGRVRPHQRPRGARRLRPRRPPPPHRGRVPRTHRRPPGRTGRGDPGRPHLVQPARDPACPPARVLPRGLLQSGGLPRHPRRRRVARGHLRRRDRHRHGPPPPRGRRLLAAGAAPGPWSRVLLPPFPGAGHRDPPLPDRLVLRRSWGRRDPPRRRARRGRARVGARRSRDRPLRRRTPGGDRRRPGPRPLPWRRGRGPPLPAPVPDDRRRAARRRRAALVRADPRLSHPRRGRRRLPVLEAPAA